MEDQPSTPAWHAKFPPFGKIDWIVNRGMLGWGTATALLSLLWKIYDGKPLSFGSAAIQTAIFVFLGGPAWGYFMWRYLSSKPSRQVQGDTASTVVNEATGKL